MDRYLTKEELLNTEEGNFLGCVYAFLNKAVEELKALNDYEIIPIPLITDEGIVGELNKLLNTDADFMYYIPLVDKLDRELKKDKVITTMIEILDEEFANTTFKDKKLITINCAGVKNSDDKNVFNIVFLMKETTSCDTSYIA